MPFGWGIVSTGKHPDIKIAPAMAVAGGGELVGAARAQAGDAARLRHLHGVDRPEIGAIRFELLSCL